MAKNVCLSDFLELKHKRRQLSQGAGMIQRECYLPFTDCFHSTSSEASCRVGKDGIQTFIDLFSVLWATKQRTGRRLDGWGEELS